MKFAPSSLGERRKFYEKEFNIGKVKKWFEDNKISFPRICALDAGSDSGLIEDKKLIGFMLYIKFSELKEKIKIYNPEDIYYDHNIYKNPSERLQMLDFNKWVEQELVFDVDSGNLSCDCKDRWGCEKCLREAYALSFRLKKSLKDIGFRKIEIVYSGRGFHVHVLDKKAFLLKRSERKSITNKFEEFPIDKWVSDGSLSLIRMPYSLNGLVSKIVTPFKSKKIKSVLKKSMPGF